MDSAGKSHKPLILLSLLILLCFSAVSVDFYAGVVSETDVSRSVISSRWLGVSGTVERGNDSLSSFHIGSLNLQENQTGEVLSASVEGIEGGGYYLVFTPSNIEAKPENFADLSNSSKLEKGGLFSQELYPDFYPDYSQTFDNPSRTFDTGKELVINGETYNASYANLSGSADMYLLRYEDGSKYVPAFVSPIDGKTRGSAFDTCYVSGCNFQALLPKLNGSSFSYSVSLFSRGEAINGCNPVDSSSASLVLGSLGQSDNCLTFNSPGAYVDFYNSRHTGDGSECGIKITAENVTVFDMEMENFDKAICVESTGAVISKGNLSENSVGISVQNSNISVSNLSIAGSSLGLVLQGSTAELRNVTLEGTPVYGEAEEVSIQSYTDAVPRPAGIEDNMEPTGSRVKVESVATDSSEARFTNLGLGYPDINTSKLLPNRIFKYDEAGDSYEMTELQADLISVYWDEDASYARYSGTLSNFSTFTLYGENIEGEESSDEESDEGQNTDDSTASGGSGSGSAGGGAGFQPRPQPVKLNLSMERSFYNVNRGDTISIEFTTNNTGSVAAENVTVGLESPWTSIPKTFEVIRPNESRSGTVLATVPDDAPVGNTSLNIGAVFGDSTVDSERFTVNISAIVNNERINVVESPSFLTLETSSKQFIGVQVENPTPEPMNRISVEFRGDNNCATVSDETYTVPAKTTETIQVELETSDQSDICNDAIVFKQGESILGFAPMRIELSEKSEDILSVPLYFVILGAWTALMVWRLKTRNDQEENRFI